MNKPKSPGSRAAGRRQGGRPSRGVPFGLVRSSLGLVLMAAGALKLFQLTFESQDESPSTLFLLIFSEAEILGGLWMLIGLEPERTRIWALAVFLGFAASSLIQALGGKCTCGCFGPLSPNPWLVLLFDVAAILALSFARMCPKTGNERSLSPLHFLGLGILALMVAAVARQQADRMAVEGSAVAGRRPLGDTMLTWTGESGKFVVQTDHDGNFRLPYISPGLYAVSAPGRLAKGPTPKPLGSNPKKGSKRSGQHPVPSMPTEEAEPLRWIELKSCAKEREVIELD
ncbi:MFS transporter [Singulisphaera rosea]